ncbi:MAG: restriction endonuclease [Deltaproteobacteria bacterium]|jgi:restriction system protein|nr:restriction endonuclease [Deltaproteobacteria bacterium]
MAIPKFDEFYKEILESLANGKLISLKKLRDSVAEMKGLTRADRAEYLKSGLRPIFDDRVHWARTYLKAAGLICYPQRGLTQITDEGKRVLEENPSVIDTSYLSQFESFRNFAPGLGKKSKSQESGEESETENISAVERTPSEQIDQALSEMNSALSDDLLTEIMRQPPAFFESLVVKLILKMGFGGPQGDAAGEVTQITGDEGIDGIIHTDRLGYRKIFIQAKRWDPQQSVSRPEIQRFVGAISSKGGDGFFVTTSSFTDKAKACAKENKIVLIDGKLLTSLMIEYDLGVSTLKYVPIKHFDSDFFPETE